MASELVYIGRDNAILLQLEDNTSGVLANSDLTSATKVELVVDGTDVYDSTNDPTVVAFTTGGLLTLKLGLALLEPDNYSVEIVVYDATNTNGVTWQPKLHVTAVESLPE